MSRLLVQIMTESARLRLSFVLFPGCSPSLRMGEEFHVVAAELATETGMDT